MGGGREGGVLHAGRPRLARCCRCYTYSYSSLTPPFTQNLNTLKFVRQILASPGWASGVLTGAATGATAAAADQQRVPLRDGIDYVCLEGGTSAEDRQRHVVQFNTDPKTRLFLASINAGNMGINLIGGSRVIIFDVNWNPAVDDQALFRCFRYGQTKPVFVCVVLGRCDCAPPGPLLPVVLRPLVWSNY